MFGHFDVRRRLAVKVQELSRQLERRGKQALAVAIQPVVVERAVGIGADKKRHAAAVADIIFERRQFIVRQSRHIQQAHGGLLTQPLGVGQKTGRLDVRLPAGPRVSARRERERKLVPAAAVLRAVDDEHRPGRRQFAGKVAAVVDLHRVGRQRRRQPVRPRAGELHAKLVRQFFARRNVLQYQGGQRVAVLLQLHRHAAGRRIAVIRHRHVHPHFDAGRPHARLRLQRRDRQVRPRFAHAPHQMDLGHPIAFAQVRQQLADLRGAGELPRAKIADQVHNQRLLLIRPAAAAAPL